MNVDIFVAVAIFLTTITFIILIVFGFFSQQLSASELKNLRIRTLEIFGKVLSEDGIVKKLYRVPIVIKEPNFDNRINEPVELKLYLDYDCKRNILNSTIRLVDENFLEVPFKKKIIDYCNNNFVKSVEILFNVNISKNGEKNYFLYFSNEETEEKNYSLKISTDSFVPKDGDSYTESNLHWYRFGGTSSNPFSSNQSIAGNYSISIEDFPANKLGLEFNFTELPTEEKAYLYSSLREGWFIRFWIFTNSTSSINYSTIELVDGNANIISKNITLKNDWNLVEEELNRTNFKNWVSFDLSNLITFRVYVVNSTISSAKKILIDGFRFEKKPLEVKIFSLEEFEIISKEEVENIRSRNLENLYGEKVHIEIRPS